jgi:hypothetical protein
MSTWASVPLSDRSKSIKYMIIFIVISVVGILSWLVFIVYAILTFTSQTSLRLYRKQLSALMR